MRHSAVALLAVVSLTGGLALAGARPALADPITFFTGGTAAAPLWPWVLGASVLVLGGLFLVLWYRRRRNDEPTQDDQGGTGEDPAYPPSDPEPEAPAGEMPTFIPTADAPAEAPEPAVAADIADPPTRSGPSHAADSLADLATGSSLTSAAVIGVPATRALVEEGHFTLFPPPKLILAVTPRKQTASRPAARAETTSQVDAVDTPDTADAPATVTADEVATTQASVTVEEPATVTDEPVAEAVAAKATRAEPELEPEPEPGPKRARVHSRYRR